eukprot:9475318-Pyramimonas_sp.AAC.2
MTQCCRHQSAPHARVSCQGQLPGSAARVSCQGQLLGPAPITYTPYIQTSPLTVALYVTTV